MSEVMDWIGYLGGAAARGMSLAFAYPLQALCVGLLLAGVPLLWPRLKHSVRGGVALRLGGWSWTRRELCCGVLIFGGRGSGKTSAGIRGIVSGLLAGEEKGFGGLCIDPKGDEYLWYNKAFGEAGRSRHVVVLQVDPARLPDCSVNLLEKPLPALTQAKWLVDAARSLRSGTEGQAFFTDYGTILIASVIAGWRLQCGKTPSPRQMCEQVASPAALSTFQRNCEIARVQALQDLKKKGGAKTVEDLNLEASVRDVSMNLNALSEIKSAPETLHGVMASARTFLQFYSEEICRVFFAEKPSHSLDAMDDGFFFVTSVPNRYEIERRLVFTLLKGWYYAHALDRYLLKPEERYARRMLVLVVDEYQDVVTPMGSDKSDAGSLAQIRDSGCTVVASTQLYSSLVVALGGREQEAKTVVGNFGTWLVFRAGEPQTAKLCSEQLGTCIKKRRTINTGGMRSGVSITDEEKPRFSVSDLLKLKTFQAVIKHESNPVPRKAMLERIT